MYVLALRLLARVYDLKDEVSIFLEFQGKQDLLLSFQSEGLQLTMAYLVDTLQTFNRLNLLMQGKKTNLMNVYDAIRTFIAKLRSWHRRVQKGIAASFPTLDIAVEKCNVNLEGELKAEVESHLQILKEKYGRYFSDFNIELADW